MKIENLNNKEIENNFEEEIYNQLKEAEQELESTTKRYDIKDIEESFNNIVEL